ncbi:GNAT family N-acetyltransferase [Pseudomonas citronellolis]|uniref:GNAT family N-acetyltransferase n=1 Tax=Pseudomonas citronellolis TaxID=53408 RepID=UPI0021C097E7|nr:GNAT family N-acetyltransferase [Pseudomonas citronellolis]UXJ50125.1 GNAT family N-acetyltransferase [Pseudomonas citronellolis]
MAAAADLPFIYEWLKLEARDGSGLINNWGMIQNACAEQKMTVFLNSEGPVAFLTYGISHSTILQTKSNCQRRGVGRALVEHAIRKEEALNNAVLIVQCEPKNSVEFWSAMGFEAHRDANYSNAIYMQRLSRIVHAHIRGDDLDMVTVSVYPESSLYSNDQMKPDRVYYVMAKFDEKSRLLNLAHRVSVAHESVLQDPVIEINWGGFEVFRGKAKHAEAAAIGIKPTPNFCGWYLDVITLS